MSWRRGGVREGIENTYLKFPHLTFNNIYGSGLKSKLGLWKWMTDRISVHTKPEARVQLG